MNCINCNIELTGRQIKFCSVKCKNQNNNKIFQIYENQKERGVLKKLELIRLAGGACQICGYNKNYSALCFHHLDPSKKDLQLTGRECSNRKLETLLEELKKCQLLCHNCHMEIHYPDAKLH
jgi:hypothetical protein